MLNKILVVSTHMDDEVLSCASFLEKDPGSIVIFYHNNEHPLFDDNVIQQENRDLISFLGCKTIISSIRAENKLDTIPQVDIISEYEDIICEEKPDIIILPFPSYNQDHRSIYEAALTALRPHDKMHFVKKVLLSEQPETFGTLRKIDFFKPNYFQKLDIERKIKLNKFYKTQLREHRSLDTIRSIAKVRGNQSGYEYAEAFEVLRWVE